MTTFRLWLYSLDFLSSIFDDLFSRNEPRLQMFNKNSWRQLSCVVGYLLDEKQSNMYKILL